MTSHVNLKEKGYSRVRNVNDYHEDLDDLVEDIVFELVTKSPKIVNDVEKGVLPYEVLQNEVTKYIDEKNITLKGEDSREKLEKRVHDYLFGYGILQDMIDDPVISDIKAIGTKLVRKKALGKRMTATDARFSSVRSLMTFCYYVSIKNGGSLSELNAVQVLDDVNSCKDFILRINIVIPPVATNGPFIHIRKIPKEKYSFRELIEFEMMNEEIADYLEKGVKSGQSIIIVGKGGAGKTTLMNTWIESIPHNRSGLIMQESGELFSDHPEMIFEKLIRKTGDSEAEYSLLKLTVNGLLQDNDYMIIGEIKGAEAMEFINAVYSGHIGGSSLHCRSAREAPNKLVHYMKYSGTDLKRNELLQMLTGIDIIVFMKDFKIYEIEEVQGYDEASESLMFNSVFKYTRKDGFKRLHESCSKIISKYDDYDEEE